MKLIKSGFNCPELDTRFAICFDAMTRYDEIRDVLVINIKRDCFEFGSNNQVCNAVFLNEESSHQHLALVPAQSM